MSNCYHEDPAQADHLGEDRGNDDLAQECQLANLVRASLIEDNRIVEKAGAADCQLRNPVRLSNSSNLFDLVTKGHYFFFIFSPREYKFIFLFSVCIILKLIFE